MSKKKSKSKSKQSAAKLKPDLSVPASAIQPLAYEDSAAAQRRDAIEADVVKINQLEETVVADKKEVLALIVKVTNAMIEQGVALQRMCGHQQVNFAFMQGMEDRLPFGWGKTKESQCIALEEAQKRVALARRFDGKPVKWAQIEELGAVKLVLQQVELLLPGTRGEMEAGAPRMEAFSQWIGRIGSIKSDIVKSFDEKPLAKRTPQQIQDFLDATQYVEDYRNEAKKALEGK
jgi:hypothetical protein